MIIIGYDKWYSYDSIVNFSNDISYKFNSNKDKFSGWLSHGIFYGKINYKYDYGMPTIPTMYRFYKKLEKYKNSKK